MNELQEIVLDLWKPNSVRSRYQTFKPIFARFEGVHNEQEFNDLCRTIEDSKDDSTLIIDGGFQFAPKLDVLAQIKKEIPGVDLAHLTRDFLVMFANDQINEVYLRVLSYTYSLAKRCGLFSNRRQEENFICNQIVLSLDYLMRLPFKADEAGKLIVYDPGTLDEKGFWFLMLCYLMGMDVLVLSPAGEQAFWKYDLDHLSKLYRNPISHRKQAFSDRVRLGKPLGKVRTTVSTLSAQTDESLFGQTGIFKPWMFRGIPVNHVQLEGTRIDLEDTWDREARLREGFQAEKKSITVPSFYVEIDGVDRNRSEYIGLLNKLKNAQNVFVDSTCGKGLFREIRPKSEAVKLVFAMNPDGTFNSKKLRETEGSLFDYVSAETGKVIVEKLNRLLRLKGSSLTKEERIHIANLVLSMSKPIARMIENFDYPFSVPKVLIFLNREERIKKEVRILLEFLSEFGFDIAVMAPSGVSGLDDPKRSILRLDQMVYDMDFPAPPIPEDEDNFHGLKSLFGLFK
ncbi:YceG family protein [Ileibacterium valens]|uniref:YceG family protein n=1 Tax=Ileibacterium valens TaxID=1862668 RepID=UPI00259B40E5|nr:YceG family protein [Ileibacterium valens]